MGDVPVDSERKPVLSREARVQIRCRYNGAWVSGFEIVERGPTGYWLRRTSDRVPLPVEFGAGDIRAIDPSS